MYPMIKLYPKLCIQGKADTVPDAQNIINDFKKRYNLGKEHCIDELITMTRRKRSCINWEISFYEDKILQEMKEDKLR